MWRFRSRKLVALLAGLVVAAAGTAFFLMRDDAAPESNGEPGRFESWNPVTPSSSYRVVIRHVKRGPTPPPQAAGGEISMLPPIDALRTIVISVDANCEATTTITVSDNATGVPWYETRTTRDGDVIEFFPRPGVTVTDENRFQELGPGPGPGIDGIQCGEEYAGPAGAWAQRLSDLGALRTGSVSYLGDAASRYELTSPVSERERENTWKNIPNSADIYRDIVAIRQLWVVHDHSGVVLATSTIAVLKDGHEELLESEEILESTVTEAQ